MTHEWYRNYNRAARPPPDIIKGAADTLVSWLLLLLFCMFLGAILILFGVDTEH